MPKQKYYYAVIKAGDLDDMKVHALYLDQSIAIRSHNSRYEIVPIPADSLHKLIKEHTKKAK